MRINLSPGTTCIANGKLVQIDGADSLTHVRARDVSTGEMVSVAISHIEVLPSEVSKASTQGIGSTEWERCVALVKAFAALEDKARVPHQDLLALAASFDLSVRQLQRLRAVHKKDRRASALARRPGGRPAGLSLLDPKVDALIRHTISKHYLRREPASKEHVVQRARSLARRLGLKPPSRAAVLSRLARAKGWAADAARHGGRAAKQKWQPRPGGLNVSRPLELIEIDHTPADVLVLTDDRLEVRGRPWVTVAIDVATRCVLGIYISMDHPSTTSVSLCIEHATLPKRENDADPGIWPMYGLPKKILVDNGKDFRSDALKRGCEEHGIDLQWRPVRTPHYGAHIERLIGTLMKLTHLLPGTTFSNVQERGDYDSESRAILTLDEYKNWMLQKICRFYHQRRHRALGMPPILAWERGLTDGAGIFRPPSLIAHPLDFRMDFLPFALRKVRRTGIELHGSRYWHSDLAPLLNSTSEAMVRYDPRDSSRVWVKRTDGFLVTAPVVAGKALNTLPRPTITEDVRANIDAEIDKGFAASDLIEDSARRLTRQTRRESKQDLGSKGETRPQSKQRTVQATPAANRNQIRVEEWE